jgi:hypothetical protein
MRTLRNASGLPWLRSCPSILLGLILLVAAAAFASDSFAVSYTFVNIADSDGMFTTTWGVGPSINASGLVAFLGFLDAGGSGIFVGDGSTVTPIALSSGSTFSSFGSADTPINAAGQVAFVGNLDVGGNGIFASDGTTTKTIAFGPPFTGFLLTTKTAINAGGTVAFDYGTGSAPGLYAGNGDAQAAPLYLTNDPMFSGFGPPVAINDSGRVGFEGILDAGGSGVYSGDGGIPTPIALSSGAFTNFTGSQLSINADGTVVFIGGLDAGTGGVFTGNGGATTQVASNTGPIANLNFPAINSAGRVAFLATLTTNAKEIMTGPDTVADKVIRNNDSLFGSVVNDLRFATSGLNDAGQVAFYYSLTDGRKGIARGTPVLELISAVSEKVHTGVGVFDINLPLTGEPGVECRNTSGTETLVFTFSNDVVSGNATVTSGTGTAGAPTFSTNTMTVPLTGVTDVQRLTVTLTGVTESLAQVLADTPVTMGVLIGDAAGTGNGSVGAADVGFVKSKSGQTTDATNFRADVAVNGSIGAGDIGLTKSKSGNVLPP